MNAEVQLTLDDAVEEVLGLLTGLDLRYAPEQDRYRSITRALNRALRGNALEQEWSYYSSTESLGCVSAGESEVLLRSSVRPRIINDDAARLVDADGTPVVWAYFLPRDALHKYRWRPELRCAVTRSTVSFSRPFDESEEGLELLIPVMREPKMFRLPSLPDDPDTPLPSVPLEVRQQLLDFAYPDVVVARAAYYYAQTDPVMQPRAQTLESEYKDLMYQLIERDTANTDSPYENDFILPVQAGLRPDSTAGHGHPHAAGGA